MSSSKFDTFIKSKPAVSGNITHTRIGDDKNKSGGGVIYGGSYTIPESDMKDFYEYYYDKVFTNKEPEYMTEKQLIEDGPIMVDVDLHYDKSVTEKKHSEDHVLDLIVGYAEKINEIVDVKKDVKIEVYVMEKSKVNTSVDGMTKDGIHLIICVRMHKGLQVMLRKRILKEIDAMWSDIPIINKWNDVFDEGITKGFCNWQVYGSRKPGHQAYLIKNHYTLTFDGSEWNVEEADMTNFNTKKNLRNLSARNKDHPYFQIREEVVEEFEEAKASLSKKSTNAGAGAGAKGEKKYKKTDAKNSSAFTSYDKINSEEMLDECIENIFDNIDVKDYKIKEAHGYTMCLPDSYYGPGTFSRWIRVGWALANTDFKLFPTWLKFTSQKNCRNSLRNSKGEFDWKNVPELFNMWCSFDEHNPDGLSSRSIMYWAKQDARGEYEKIRKDTIRYYIDQSVVTATEYDLAMVLYQMYKDRFVCVSVTNNCWYEFKSNRWVENDSGNTLRLLISKDMHQLYFMLVNEMMATMDMTDDGGNKDGPNPKKSEKDAKMNKLSEIMMYLKRTTWKNNIMREARDIFYVENFMEKLDTKPYLLCCSNFVIDFENGIHRKGQPDDYLSKCTNIDYIPLNEEKHKDTIAEINLFMDQLFPEKELRQYMWQHLASCLVGTNDNQAFNIYTGSGANGKSKLVELMSKCLGDYKATVPITLITGKRNSIGSTSSEIVQLKGVRYAVIQEPSKNEQINEGIMKEITGGDPIQGRALFKDMITFIPQFKLTVCTNTMFDIKSNDDGTWRRIRVNDFKAKFVEEPYEDPRFSREDYPHQFKMDKKIDTKFTQWVPIFMSMLVKISYKMKGIVDNCSIVMASSNNYRDGQDYLTEFLKERIRRRENGRVKKMELSEEFKKWYTINIGRNVPKTKEIFDYVEKKFGKCHTDGWHNIEIIYENVNDTDD
jgi:P4 family phage/plasmid primase-like protien